MEEEVQGVWMSQDRSGFEVTKRGGWVEFSKESDGEFYIAILDGYQRQSFRMTVKQFEAFMNWIMEK